MPETIFWPESPNDKVYQCVLQTFSKGHKNLNKKKSCIGIDTPCTTREKERYMREKDIEKKLSLMVKKAGGIAVKFVSPSFDGMPDRLVLLPDGVIAFVELKAPGKKMRPLQEKRKRTLEELGFLVFCVDSKEMIGGVLHEIRTL